MNTETETPRDIAMRDGNALLCAPDTSVDDLAAAGWHLEMNMGGNVFFRHLPTKSVLSMPFWAKQMITQARMDGAAHARQEIRDALGIADA